MRILFVYPNVQKGAHSPQLGIASLSGILKENGHTTDLYDVTVVPDGKEQQSYLDKINAFQPDIIAYSIRSNEMGLVRALLSVTPRNQFLLVAGGHHVTVATEEITELFDIAVRGEGEGPMLDIANKMELGEDLTDIPNVWVKDGENLIKNDLRPLLDIDELPMPDWRLFDDVHFYKHYLITGVAPYAKVVGTFEGSRGCIFSCTYCSSPHVMKMYGGASWRREKSAGKMADEINAFQNEFGLDFMYFVDEIFLTKVNRLKEIRDVFQDRVNKPFTFMERPELVTEEKIKLIREAGATNVAIGVESGDEEFRRSTLDRRTPQGKIVDAFRMAKEVGLKTHAFNMVGLPGESHNVIEENFKLLSALKPDSFQVSIFYPLIGTELHKVCKEKGFLESDEMPANYYEKSALKMNPSEGLNPGEIVRYQQLLPIFVGKNIFFARFFFRYLAKHPFLFRLVYLISLAPKLKMIPKALERFGFQGAIKEISRRVGAVIKNSRAHKANSEEISVVKRGTDSIYD